MKNLILQIFVTVVVLSHFSSTAQIRNPRKLTVFVANQDSTFFGAITDKKGKKTTVIFEPEVKRDAKGTITSLYQYLFDKSENLILIEEYKVGKRWELYSFIDTLQIKYELTQQGKMSLETYSKRIVQKANTLEPDRFPNAIKLIFYDYYTNGQLKYKLDQRYSKQGILVGKIDTWNILEYYYPDGKPYTDWGTLKDGIGYYNVLDDNGKICDVCTENIKKGAAKKEGVKKKN